MKICTYIETTLYYYREMLNGAEVWTTRKKSTWDGDPMAARTIIKQLLARNNSRKIDAVLSPYEDPDPRRQRTPPEQVAYDDGVESALNGSQQAPSSAFPSMSEYHNYLDGRESVPRKAAIDTTEIGQENA